jgi:hypothetical protein
MELNRSLGSPYSSLPFISLPFISLPFISLPLHLLENQQPIERVGFQS